MSKVYVVQIQQQWDDGRTTLLPKFDLRPAEKFGELVYLLGPDDVPFESEAAVTKLKERLDDITDDDFILLIGNPCFIGWACAIAAGRLGGKIKLLQWAKRDRDYRVVVVKI